MPEQIYEKIESKIKYKLPFIIMYIIATIFAMVALKYHDVKLDFNPAATLYLIAFGIVLILIVLILAVVSTRFINKTYAYINHFIKDCNDNIVPLIMLNTPAAAYFSIQLYHNFNFINSSILLLLYLVLLVSPLVFTWIITYIYNIIVDILNTPPQNLIHMNKLKLLCKTIWHDIQTYIKNTCKKNNKLIC